MKTQAYIALELLQTDPAIDLGELTEKVKRLAAQRHIPYNTESVRRAVDSAQHLHANPHLLRKRAAR